MPPSQFGREKECPHQEVQLWSEPIREVMFLCIYLPDDKAEHAECFTGQSYSFHRHRAFSQAKTCAHIEMKEKKSFSICWSLGRNSFASSLAVQTGHSLQVTCSWTRLQNGSWWLSVWVDTLPKTRCYWFTGRISWVKHMCAPWQSTLFCSKPCWANV